jgi:broad specificity phosphatase PhoE
MTVRLTLVCHAPTAALARAAFPADEPLTERGARDAAGAAAAFGGVGAARCGPEIACVQTAQALGLDPLVDPALRDCDYGRWRGHRLEEIEPAAVTAWLTDPAAVPHGGESILELLARLRAWLATQAAERGRQIAVTHPAVIRATMVTVLDASPAAFWRIDIPPLSRICLTSQGGVWRFRGTA